GARDAAAIASAAASSSGPARSCRSCTDATAMSETVPAPVAVPLTAGRRARNGSRPPGVQAGGCCGGWFCSAAHGLRVEPRGELVVAEPLGERGGATDVGDVVPLELVGGQRRGLLPVDGDHLDPERGRDRLEGPGDPELVRDALVRE